VEEYLNDTSGPTAKDEWTCVNCPDGADCKGHKTYSELSSKNGYWRVPDTYFEFFSPPKVQPEYALCEYPERCNFTSISNASTGGTEMCPMEGTEGPMCAICSENYNLDSKGRCIQCSNGVLAERIFLCLAVMLVVSLFLFLIERVFAKLPRRYKDMKKDIFRLGIVLINFGQVGSSMPSVFRIRWPPKYLELLKDINGIFNFNILQLSGVPCATKINYGSRLVAMSILPVLVLLITGILAVVEATKRKRLVQKLIESGHEHKVLKSSLVHVFEMVDHDGSDTLSVDELQELFEHVGRHITRKQTKTLIQQWQRKDVDSESDSFELEQSEFIDGMLENLSTLMSKKQEKDLINWAEGDGRLTRAISHIGEIMFIIHSPVSKVAFEWHSTLNLGDRYFLRVDPGIEHECHLGTQTNGTASPLCPLLS